MSALMAVGKGSNGHVAGLKSSGSRASSCHGRKIAMAVILIVEDDELVRQIAELMIEDRGHSTFSACDMDEALSVLRSPQHIDALFTDIYLKTAVLGGCDLARSALKLRPGLRVLYTTGNRMTETLQALFAEGTHFLRKPYTEHQLRGSVENMLVN